MTSNIRPATVAGMFYSSQLRQCFFEYFIHHLFANRWLQCRTYFHQRHAVGRLTLVCHIFAPAELDTLV